MPEQGSSIGYSAAAPDRSTDSYTYYRLRPSINTLGASPPAGGHTHQQPYNAVQTRYDFC